MKSDCLWYVICRHPAALQLIALAMAALRFTLSHLQKSPHAKSVFCPVRGGRCGILSRNVLSTSWKNPSLFLQPPRKLFATSTDQKWTPPSSTTENDIPDAFDVKEDLKKLEDDETPDDEHERIGMLRSSHRELNP